MIQRHKFMHITTIRSRNNQYDSRASAYLQEDIACRIVDKGGIQGLPGTPSVKRGKERRWDEKGQNPAQPNGVMDAKNQEGVPSHPIVSRV